MKILKIAFGILLVAVTGCTTPRTIGTTEKFEFPYVNDYSISNYATFRWSDSFLTNNCDIYHQELAGPLCAIAASTYGYRMYMDSRTLFRIGFSPETMYRRYGADINYKHPKYGKNQIGFTLAHKKSIIDDKTTDILMIALRGTFGRDEWLSNMNACNSWGSDDNPDPEKIPFLHEGFRIAADAVEEAVKGYVARQNINLASAKIVIAGHSRGAAVANILGARINEQADGMQTGFFSSFSRANLYVYTFATPNTVLLPENLVGNTLYGNIFNIINPEDIVPMVPLADWNYRRYGRNLFLKNYDQLSLWEIWTDNGYNSMKDNFRSITGYEWWHMPLGTNSTYAIPQLLAAVAPSIPELYALTPQQREDGNLTSIHSILETAIYRSFEDPIENEKTLSLGSDVNRISGRYNNIDKSNYDQRKEIFYNPDGKDFSRQPGIFDIPWRLACMHATQTYIGWMKAAEKYGPESAYLNWHETSGGETDR
ncbi:MAG: lipase family protein [Kiritimatiellae bacterium]|nr:lipase family protein [Kiritimatiellia bacterium]